MKLTRSKKIILTIILAAFVVLLFNSNTVFAAINSDYAGTDTVTDTAINEAVSESLLIELLAKLVYAVGRLLEWLIGTIFSLLTGSSNFPWADKIVFNSIPLLDVNFINPGGVTASGESLAKYTFVGNSAIQGVLKNLYSTIMTLAVAFFGIVVLITAIRLVITTIASEKAKYKQAIVDWLVGFVTLFCIHYFISFVFYLNEQLVIVASKMVTAQLESSKAIARVAEDELAQELIADARAKKVMYNGELAADLFERYPRITQTWMNLVSNDTSKGFHEAFMKHRPWYTFGLDVAKNENEAYRIMAIAVTWAAEENISVTDLALIRKNNIHLIIDEDVTYNSDLLMWTTTGGMAIKTTDFMKAFTNSKGNKNVRLYNDFLKAMSSFNGTYKGKFVTDTVNNRKNLTMVENGFFKSNANELLKTGDNLYLLSSRRLWLDTLFQL